MASVTTGVGLLGNGRIGLPINERIGLPVNGIDCQPGSAAVNSSLCKSLYPNGIPNLTNTITSTSTNLKSTSSILTNSNSITPSSIPVTSTILSSIPSWVWWIIAILIAILIISYLNRSK